MKQYRLIGPDGQEYLSDKPGCYGGNKSSKLYGRLNCTAALRAMPQGYAALRVFFADEETAIAAGYRPCGNCLRDRYRVWKAGGIPGIAEYPWLVTPT